MLRHWPAAIFLPLILALNAVGLSRLGFVEFGDMDWGGFLDASWRVFRGQKVYHDFFYHSGPVHLYMNAFFFRLFGFGKTAILAHLITVNTLMILATFFASYRRVPVFFTLLTTVHTMICFYWIYPHPYYDYSAHFWGLLGVFAMAWLADHGSHRLAPAAGAFCGFMAALSILTKLNVGAPYAVVFVLVLLTHPSRLRLLAAFAAGIGAGLGAVLASVSSIPEMISCIREFSAVVSGRLVRFILLPVYLKNFFWIPLIVVYLSAIGRRGKFLPLYLLVIGLYFIGTFTVNTGSFRDWDYLAMMGMYLALSYRVLFHILGMDIPPKTRRRIVVGLALITAAAGVQLVRASSVCAYRIQIQFGESAREFYALEAKPFRGWLFYRQRGQDLDSMVRYIDEVVPQNETLLVLSYLQVIYPLTGRDSFRGIPFHWFPGSVPAPGPQWLKVRGTILGNPPDWILASRDGLPGHPLNEIAGYLQIPMEFFTTEYELAQAWTGYALLRRVRSGDLP